MYYVVRIIDTLYKVETSADHKLRSNAIQYIGKKCTSNLYYYANPVTHVCLMKATIRPFVRNNIANKVEFLGQLHSAQAMRKILGNKIKNWYNVTNVGGMNK